MHADQMLAMGTLILEPSRTWGPLGMEAVDRWPRVPVAVSSAQGGLGEHGVHKEYDALPS